MQAWFPSRNADCYQRSTKALLIFLYAGSTLSLIIFSLICDGTIPFHLSLIYVTYVLTNVLLVGTNPLLLELAAECTYPVPEAITTSFMSMLSSGVMLVFYVIFMFPNMDVLWINWVNAVSTALCVPGLLFYSAKFTRLDIDALTASASHSLS